MIVDDQEEIHRDFRDMLNPNAEMLPTDDLAGTFGSSNLAFLPDFELFHARSGEEAYEKVKEAIEEDNPIAVAYIDVRMPPGMDGIETTRNIREIDRDIEIVIMTAYTNSPLSEIIHDMKLLNKLLYIRKPFSNTEIQQMALSLTQKWNIEKRLMERTEELVLNKQRLEAVLDSTMDAIAMFDVTGHLLLANRWYEELFGLTDGKLENMSSDELRQLIKECFQEPDLYEETETLFFANPEKTFEDIIELRQPAHRMLYQFTAPVYKLKKNIVGRIIVYRDVSKELEIDRMKEEILRLRSEIEMEYSFDNIIGESKKMQDVYAQIKQVTESDITVLIRGETGTGKELVARAIHYNSPRKSGPFIVVNCAAIPENLIESELFGHERGAFTGATRQKIGKFEEANGGTIFLDEIAEMTPSLQARLLRVLQDGKIQRVGGTGNILVDIRVLAATNKKLEDAIKTGEFREDLFYRIAAFPIFIPPLRERREDIPLLAEHFLIKHAQGTDKSAMLISTEALQLLMNYDWAGNVRELENAIKRGILLETSSVLQASNLPPRIHSLHKQYACLPTQSEDLTTTEIIPLEEVEKRALAHALKVTGNNIRQAAKALGVNRTTIYRKLEKYNMLETTKDDTA